MSRLSVRSAPFDHTPLAHDPPPGSPPQRSSACRRLLRNLARVRNLDGPDDIASGIPAAMSKAHAPFVEIGLLGALFPLVASAAAGAVRAARAAYARDYPDSVRRTLAQQQRLIDAMRHADTATPGATAAAGVADATATPQADARAELQPLVDLHARGVARLEARERHRAQGLLPLLRHNLSAKRRHEPGNGALSQAFNAQADALIARRFARDWRLDTVETTYQSQRARQCEREQKSSKRTRTARLLTGIGMPGMATGMASAAGRSAAAAGAHLATDAAGQAGALAAQQVLGAVTGGIMMGAQAAQGASGLLNGRLHAAQCRLIRQERDALRAIATELPARVPALLEQDTRARLSDGVRSQVCDGLLSAGQALMLGASASAFVCPPVALGLAVPGIALTLGGSVGGAVNEARRERYLGEGAPPSVKATALGNLGVPLRERGLGPVLGEVARRFEAPGHPFVRADTRAALTDLAAVIVERRARHGYERHAMPTAPE